METSQNKFNQNKFKISKKEKKAGSLPEKIDIFTLISRLRLPLKSNVKSRIDLTLTPYLVEPLTHVNKYSVDWIYVIAPTQSGKTVILQCAFADHLYQGRGNAIYCLPDLESGKTQVVEKLISIIKATPFLNALAIQPESKNLTHKILRLVNKNIYLAWSNSKPTMNSKPVPKVYLDEVRLFKQVLGQESNAIKLLNDRMKTYGDMKQGIGVSSPSHEGDLLHRQTKVKGTKVYYYMCKCPHCGKHQFLDFFKNVLPFPAEKGNKGVHCKYCREDFNIGREKRNLKGAYATIDMEGRRNLPRVDSSRRMVFRYDSLVSPFTTIDEIRTEYNETRDSLPDYRNFIQAWLARFWKLSKSKISKADIKKSELAKAEVPTWTKILTAGVDTQDDGFYTVVMAFGKGMKAHVVDNFFIKSDMRITSEEEIEDLLRGKIEEVTYTTRDGDDWQIAVWGIDTKGHRTKQITPVLGRLGKCVPIAGRNTQRDAIEVSSNQNLYFVASDIYAEETEKRMANIGFHYGIDDNFIQQVLAYQKVEDDKADKRGDRKIYWKKLGQNDYRMALIYNFVCLDIDFGGFSHRVKLNKDDYYANPVFKQKRKQKDNTESVPPVEEPMPMDLGGFGADYF